MSKNVFFMLLSLCSYLFHENETFATLRSIDFQLFRDLVWFVALCRWVILLISTNLTSITYLIFEGLILQFIIYYLSLRVTPIYTWVQVLGEFLPLLSYNDHEKCTFFLCKYHFWSSNFLKILTVWNVFVLVVDQLFSSVSIGIIRPFISRSLWISQYLTLNSLLKVAFFCFLWGLYIGLPRFNLYYLFFCIAFSKWSGIRLLC